jgi:hypothetical protein
MAQIEFKAPGPGSWELEQTKPVSFSACAMNRREATTMFADGVRVRVNGDNGTVEIVAQ